MKYPSKPLIHMAGSRLPIDRDHLSRYTMGDEALEQEILGLFLETMARCIADLTSPADEKQWAMAVHTLKGSSRAVGAWNIASIAEQAEQAADATQAPGQRDDFLSSLKAAATRTADFINSQALTSTGNSAAHNVG